MSRTPTPRAVRRSLREIGEHLRAWRKLQSLTIEQVADRAGINRLTVSHIEHGEGASLENVLRVARALGQLPDMVDVLDPYETDIGRLRADEALPQRVRRSKEDDGES